MKERIEKIMELERLSASKFADAIGVQRSSISHILSGRNKPSLELVNKILDQFQEINADWLLLGKGQMRAIDIKDDIPNKSGYEFQSKENGHQKEISTGSQNSNRFPVKIVVFYSDNTFEEFQAKS